MPATDAPETILTRARLCLPEGMAEGTIVLRAGRIAEIDCAPNCAPNRAPSRAAGAIDCAGDIVAPGLVELHTDNLERHLHPRPSVDWPHAAAIMAHDAELAGVGITTVFDALRIGAIPSAGGAMARSEARALWSEIAGLRAAGHLRIDHALHLRAELCSETLAGELEAFGPGDDVRLISLMDHTPLQRQFRDLRQLRAFAREGEGMSEAAFKAHVAFLRDLGARKVPEHEVAAVAAARRLGAALASHDDTTPEDVARSAAHGVRLAEFPTTRAAAEACRAHGIAVMMGAPNLIRGGSHSGNVAAEELARAGLIDVLSSDYVPAGLLIGAFALGAILGDTARGIAAATAAPAAAAGLADRGRLVPGLRADVIRIADSGPLPRLRGVWSGGVRVG